MTLYTRGYRRYEDGFQSRHLRFTPIFVEGYREAVRSKSFRRFTSLFVLLMIFYCVLYYVNPMELAKRLVGSDFPHGPSRSEQLRENVASYMAALDWLAPLLALFVGSGLVAEDLRTRALPLYLVRPITPVDYWFGKWLILAGVLGISMLAPALFLVLFGILLEPSETVLSFAAEQGRLVVAILAAYVTACAAYGSLVLLFSTIAGRRTPALILGAATVFLSPVVVGFALAIRSNRGRDVVALTSGPLDLVKALILPLDVTAVFRGIAGSSIDAHDRAIMPPMWAALGMVTALFLLSAFVVIRRARTVEVVS